MDTTKPRVVAEYEAHTLYLYKVDDLLNDTCAQTMIEAPDGGRYLVNTTRLLEMVEHRGLEPVSMPIEAGALLSYTNEVDETVDSLSLLWITLGNLKGVKTLYVRSIFINGE